MWINAATAAAMGVESGDDVRLTRTLELYNDREQSTTMGTTKTSIVCEAKVTQLIHPRAVALPHHLGHWAYGRYASGNPNPLAADPDQAAQAGADPDAEEVWWDKHGYRPNWLMPNAGDPIGGGLRWMDAVVRVEPA